MLQSLGQYPPSVLVHGCDHLEKTHLRSQFNLLNKFYISQGNMASYGENRPRMGKLPNAKGVQMEGSRAALAQANGRRVLGDIGNVVGALPHRCTVSKDGLHQQTRSKRGMKHEVEGSAVVSMEYSMTSEKENEPMITASATQNEDDHECCEVEMEDPVDPMLDIDQPDEGNPLAVADYVQDIYSFYRLTENLSCVSPDYMSQQTDINWKMRAILIDWLIEVHLKFELMDETLFLTINLIDRYLSSQRVTRKHLQLVGVTAMLLACKYEEVCVPVVEDFVLISDNAYTRYEVLHMEKLMLNNLQFNISVPTPYVFLKRFLKAALFDKRLEVLAFFLIELCLVEYVMLKYQPSMLAAAAVYTAQCTLSRVPSWNRTIQLLTNYSEDQLQECAKLMVDFHQKAGEGKLTCVHRKYSTPKFNSVADLEPAFFIRGRCF